MSGPRLKRALRLLAATAAVLVAVGCYAVRPAPLPSPDAPRAAPANLRLHVGGAGVRIWALPTGNVAVKECHQRGCLDEATPYPVRLGAILLDAGFAPPMPIWTYLIEHPEGRFLVDTGERANFYDASTWSCDERSRMVSHAILQLDIRPEEEIDQRLGALGLAPNDLDGVVITHQHVDHTGGLALLPDTPVYLGQADLDAAEIIGSVRCRTLDRHANLVPVEPLLREARSADAGDRALGPSFPLTPDGRLRVYATPGHTPGSLTVRLEADEGDVWFIGDTAFTEAGLDPRAATAGIHVDLEAVRALQDAIGSLDRALVLPAHDEDVPARMAALDAQVRSSASRR